MLRVRAYLPLPGPLVVVNQRTPGNGRHRRVGKGFDETVGLAILLVVITVPILALKALFTMPRDREPGLAQVLLQSLIIAGLGILLFQWLT